MPLKLREETSENSCWLNKSTHTQKTTQITPDNSGRGKGTSRALAGFPHAQILIAIFFCAACSAHKFFEARAGLHVCACPEPKQILDKPQMRERKPEQCSERRTWLLRSSTVGQRAAVASGFHFGELDPSSEALGAASAQKDESY